MPQPNSKQAAIDKLFPAIATWVREYGHIEIGDQESFGFTARAIGYGGLVFEDDAAETLVEAMTSLEQRIAKHLEQNEL